MRNKLVAGICVANITIVAGLIWFIFGNKPDRPMMLEQTPGERLSDVEYWEQAQSAKSFREALFQLNQIKDQETLKAQATQEIEKLLFAEQQPLDRWPVFQAVLQKFGSVATNRGELTLLTQITSNTDQAITLRDTAFRSYVENYLRLKVDTETDDTILVLIDRLFQEKNSLAETALQAEHFLAKNDTLSSERKPAFNKRLQTVLEDSQRAESLRITAMNILGENGALADLPLDRLYPDAGVRLQTAILHALAGNNTPEEVRRWLETVQPTTPEQEQLRLRILGQ